MLRVLWRYTYANDSHLFLSQPRMARAQPTLIPLGDLPLGCSARIAEIRGGRQLARRLLALGLRVGSEILVLHQRGNGLVVLSGDTRVALGGGIVEKLWVEPPSQPPPSGDS